MAARQARALPKSMRNPIDALEMAGHLRDAADAIERDAEAQGRKVRARAQVLRVRAFATELEDWANAKIGDHEARLRG